LTLKIFKLDIGKYFIVSCLVSIIDFFISYLLYKLVNVNYLAACNIGIILGFIFQYFICTKYIFKTKVTISSLMVFLTTFFIGIALADGTIWTSYSLLHLSFFISKILSMGVPFFITYFIRRLLLGVKRGTEVQI
jgi:putative flippase GtrA